MIKKSVGHVSEEEKLEIQRLFERKNGLMELAKILTPDNTDLYERLVCDMGETNVVYQSWWNKMSTKYKWDYVSGGNWVIDFETCEIFLVTE